MTEEKGVWRHTSHHSSCAFDRLQLIARMAGSSMRFEAVDFKFDFTVERLWEVYNIAVRDV